MTLSAAALSPNLMNSEGGDGFWYELINEAEAAKFLNLTARTIQGYRYKGGGPRYVRISPRCVKYRRIDCRDWVEVRMRTSTSDPGPEAAL